MLDSAKRNEIEAAIQSLPFLKILPFEVSRLDRGYCELRAPYRAHYDGIFRSFHGGLLLTLADSAACFAILTLTGTHVRMATTDMNIRFLAPCRSDVIVKANVIKLGSTLAPATVDLFDEEDRHVAVAQVTYMLLKSTSD